jgi:hypothetical protein
LPKPLALHLGDQQLEVGHHRLGAGRTMLARKLRFACDSPLEGDAPSRIIAQSECLDYLTAIQRPVTVLRPPVTETHEGIG